MNGLINKGFENIFLIIKILEAVLGIMGINVVGLQELNDTLGLIEDGGDVDGRLEVVKAIPIAKIKQSVAPMVAIRLHINITVK